ncbi:MULTISPECIES: DUF5999 family protein [Streptomyces]
MCKHALRPSVDSSDREAGVPQVHDDIGGWTRLCNGVFLFHDIGALLPDGAIVAPSRPVSLTGTAA